MISAPKNDSTVAVKTPGSAINGQVIWKTRLLEEETGLLTNHNGGGGELQLEIHTATERGSFFPNREPWRAAKLGVNGYWQPQNVLKRK